jgi:hypothetical protein
MDAKAEIKPENMYKVSSNAHQENKYIRPGKQDAMSIHKRRMVYNEFVCWVSIQADFYHANDLLPLSDDAIVAKVWIITACLPIVQQSLLVGVCANSGCECHKRS